MFRIQNGIKNANIPRTIRFTEKLFEALQEVATKHEVSFNSLILQCCQYALKESAEEKIEKQDFQDKGES